MSEQDEQQPELTKLAQRLNTPMLTVRLHALVLSSRRLLTQPPANWAWHLF